MGSYVHAISADGNVMCQAVDSTDIVAQAERIHVTSATVTAALGRLLTAASLMGSQLKGEEDSLTLRINADGPIGALIAVSDSSGNVRGYVENPVVEIPLNQYGKLDVAGAVGRQGNLFVMRDLGMREPYIGQTPIVSGEIAEDITHYYAASEQTPTVCALGVLVNTDLTVISAGGFLLQLLPGAPEEIIEQVEAAVNGMPPVTKMLAEGSTPQDIVRKALDGFSPAILEERRVAYQCNCSRERVERALISIGREELCKMAGEQPVTEVDCHFCIKKYRFSPIELRALAKR